MMRLQRLENGSYFADFFLYIPDMRSFLNVREIVRICPRSPIVSIKPLFRYRTPKSDRLLGEKHSGQYPYPRQRKNSQRQHSGDTTLVGRKWREKCCDSPGQCNRKTRYP